GLGQLNLEPRVWVRHHSELRAAVVGGHAQHLCKEIDLLLHVRYSQRDVVHVADTVSHLCLRERWYCYLPACAVTLSAAPSWRGWAPHAAARLASSDTPAARPRRVAPPRCRARALPAEAP